MIAPRLKSLTATTSDAWEASVDLAIYTCGYESRASHIATRPRIVAGKQFAFAFQANQVHAFRDNYAILRKHDVLIEEMADDEVYLRTRALIRELADELKTETLRVLVDISSFSRVRLAAVLEALANSASACRIVVFFAYSEGRYAMAALEAGGPCTIEPVSGYFSGIMSDPELPVSLILGVGYEPNRAYGAMEFFEPGRAWVLVPQSLQQAFDGDLVQANSALYDRVGAPHVLPYRVDAPAPTYALLVNLAAREREGSRVVIVPSGPKVLALLSMILALQWRDIAIWRLQSQLPESPVNREASGRIVVVECVFPSSKEVVELSTPQHDS